MEDHFNLPESLKPFDTLAYNLWFSWNPDVRYLFREIDINLWRSVDRNPVSFLQHVDKNKLKSFSENKAFVDKLNKIYKRFTTYMEQKDTHFNENYPTLRDQLIAYFSAEYGLHESLPNYAGGLGILAGDHCKTASDLGLPFVAVGLMYKHAYFTQYVSEAGEQNEDYKKLNLSELPITPVTDENGDLVLVSVPIIDHDVYIKIWKVNVGRIKLFLLDTSPGPRTKWLTRSGEEATEFGE